MEGCRLYGLLTGGIRGVCRGENQVFHAVLVIDKISGSKVGQWGKPLLSLAEHDYSQSYSLSDSTQASLSTARLQGVTQSNLSSNKLRAPMAGTLHICNSNTPAVSCLFVFLFTQQLSQVGFSWTFQKCDPENYTAPRKTLPFYEYQACCKGKNQ